MLLWTFVYKSVCEHVFLSLSISLLRGGIAGSLGNSVFNLLRNCQTVFQSGCAILHFCRCCMSVPVSPHPWQRLSFWLKPPGGVKWYHAVILFYKDLINYWKQFLKKVYSLLRETETEQKRRRAERKGDRIWSRLHALSRQLRARCGARIHKPWDHNLSQSWTPNRISHPGAPYLLIFFF